jgi:hypothetical protein
MPCRESAVVRQGCIWAVVAVAALVAHGAASVPLPAGAETVSVRAVDEQGNVGRSATFDLR